MYPFSTPWCFQETLKGRIGNKWVKFGKERKAKQNHQIGSRFFLLVVFPLLVNKLVKNISPISVMLYAIRSHLYNLKNVRNTYGAVLHGYFLCFLNCKHGSRLRKASHLNNRKKQKMFFCFTSAWKCKSNFPFTRAVVRTQNENVQITFKVFVGILLWSRLK